LSELQASTYLGGADDFEYGGFLAFAPDGDVLVLGHSSSSDVPGLAGGVQQTAAGLVDFLVSRLSSDLDVVRQSTYVGGSGNELSRGLVVTEEGDVIVLGDTDGADFPGTEGGFQESAGGNNDAVLARLSGDL